MKGRRYTALVLLFLVPLVWVGLGAWLLAAGLGIRSQVDAVAGWPQTTGRVTGFQTDQPSYAKNPAYRPVIAFRAAGQIILFYGAEVPDPPAVGVPARVAYDPRNPADAHDLSLGSDGYGQIYLGVAVLVSGVALMAFLYWLVFLRQKSARRAAGPFSAETGGRHVRGS